MSASTVWDATRKEVKGDIVEFYREFFHRLDLAARSYPREVTLAYEDFRELFGNCGLAVEAAALGPTMTFYRGDTILCAFDSGVVGFRCARD